MESLNEQVRRELEADEARRTQPYDDKTGKPPILARYEKGRLVPTGGKVSIAIGRNLTDRILSDAVIDLLFEEDLEIAYGIVSRLFPDFDSFTQNRRAALLNMAFNLGNARLMGFRNMIRAVRSKDWSTAAAEALDSKWAKKDVQKSRSARIAAQLRHG